MLPVLYSFRLCLHAIRVRMTLMCASITVELRQVFLAEKTRGNGQVVEQGHYARTSFGRSDFR